MSKHRLGESSKGSTTGTIGLGVTGARKRLPAARPTVDASITPDPVAPPKLHFQQVPGDLVLSTVDGTITLPLSGYCTSDAGIRAAETQAFPGRETRTLLGDWVPMTMVCPAMPSRWVGQGSIEDEVSALFAASWGGQLVRAYGPILPPASQGLVWAFSGQPQVDGANALGLPSAELSHAPITINLMQWNPMAPVVLHKTQTHSTGAARKKAGKKAKASKSKSAGG